MKPVTYEDPYAVTEEESLCSGIHIQEIMNEMFNQLMSFPACIFINLGHLPCGSYIFFFRLSKRWKCLNLRGPSLKGSMSTCRGDCSFTNFNVIIDWNLYSSIPWDLCTSTLWTFPSFSTLALTYVLANCSSTFVAWNWYSASFFLFMIKASASNFYLLSVFLMSLYFWFWWLWWVWFSTRSRTSSW